MALKLNPSHAHRRLACPGSLRMCENLPPLENTEREEGILAHEYLSWYLKSRARLTDGYFEDEYKITPEMKFGADLVWDAIVDMYGVPEGGPWGIETRITALRISETSTGYVDVWLFSRATRELFVFDYKFGHAFVSARDNPQLVIYASGLTSEFGERGILPEGCIPLKTHFIIVQPRCFQSEKKVRTATYTYEEFLKLEALVRESEQAALQEDAPCIPNVECKYCPARAQCGPLQESAISAIEPATERVLKHLTPREAGNELRFLKHTKKILDARVEALETEATQFIKKGKNVPFYKLEPGQSKLNWTASTIEEIRIAGDLLGIKNFSRIELITPTQAIAAGMNKEYVDSKSARVAGGLKLKEVDLEEAANEFKH